MGTRLEPTFNPLATSAHSSSNTNTLFTVQRVNEWHHNFQDSTRLLPPIKFYTKSASAMTGVDNFQDAVNKMLQKGDVDAIRKTMQLHEHLFKNQVKELHRLYSVQKRLMEELMKETKPNALWGPMEMGSSIGINHLQFNNQSIGGGGGVILNPHSSLRDDPIIRSTRERSGSYSGDNMRMSRGFDLERPAAAEEDMSTGVSTVDEDGQAGPSTPIVKMSIDGCEEEEESGVELTLSIGGSISKKRSSKSKILIQKDREIIDSSNLSFKTERGDQECSDPSTPMSSSSATCDNQETKRPHWLFQSLKLK